MDDVRCQNLSPEQREAVAAMLDALEVVKHDAKTLEAWIRIECITALKKGLDAFDPNAPRA
jgi:hypothetical protein